VKKDTFQVLNLQVILLRSTGTFVSIIHIPFTLFSVESIFTLSIIL